MSKPRWTFVRDPASSEVTTAIMFEGESKRIEITGTLEQIGQTIAYMDPMPWDVEHSLAEAWASLDGRVGVFHLCRIDAVSEDRMGRYEGYLADARSMIERAKSRDLVIGNIWALRAIVLIVFLIGIGLGSLL